MSLDVLVVGGGPVGLVTALHAHRRGLSVEIVEPRAQPVDKACGEGIMPAGIEQLAALGVDPPGHVIRGIRYLSAKHSVDAQFTHGAGRGVRRPQLQRALVDAVQAAGIAVRASSVVALHPSPDRVDVRLRDGSSTPARFVVGADGLHSTVRRLCGLSTRVPRRGRRHGLRQHFTVAPWSDLVEVHWAADAEAYVTPIDAGLVGIALLTDRTGTFDERLRAFPALLERIRGAEPASGVLGAGPLRQRSSAAVSGRAALVGDAAGYVDAITGEGLTVGWRQAAALVDAISSGSLDRYERERRRVARRSTVLTSGLLTVARGTATRRLIVPAAARCPGLFGRLVDLVSRG